MTDSVTHPLLDQCPECGEVVRNDMSVYYNPKTRVREHGHVQFACNYEIEVDPTKGPSVIRECRKGQTWPKR